MGSPAHRHIFQEQHVRWSLPLKWCSSVWAKNLCLKQQGLQKMGNLISVAQGQTGGIPTAEKRAGWPRAKNPYSPGTEHHTRWRAICTAKEPRKTKLLLWKHQHSVCSRDATSRSTTEALMSQMVFSELSSSFISCYTIRRLILKHCHDWEASVLSLWKTPLISLPKVHRESIS